MTTFEIGSFSYCRSLRSFPFPLGSHPFSSVAKTRLAFTYCFNGESIHSFSKGWRPTVGGTIVLSGRFRLIESGRDKEGGEKRLRQKGKPRRVDLSSSRGLQPGVERKVRGTRRYKVLFTPSPTLLQPPSLYLIPRLSRTTFNVSPFFITQFSTVSAFSDRFSPSM